jgi:hypothetical protein
MEYIIVGLTMFNILVCINAFIVNRTLKWLLRDERLNAEYMKLTNVRLEKLEKKLNEAS